MTFAASNDLLQSSDKQHLMLLYDDEDERSAAEIDCINRVLDAGQYCIYATVDASDKDFLANLAPRIADYDRHIQEGNFVIVNFKPFYDSAANCELTPFKQLKAQVEETLKDRIASGKNEKALIVADAACNLARHKQFDECVTLEGWWQGTYNDWMAKNLDISIICAHPSSVLKQQLHIGEQKRISHAHSLKLDLNDFIGKNHGRILAKQAKPQKIQILLAESEADIRTIYRDCLKSLPVELVIVKGADECLEQVLMRDKRDFYDIIIIDTHVKDASGFDIAKKILQVNPDQQIIFTTTSDLDPISSGFKAHSLDIDKYPILQKPFLFSQLLGLIKPAKSK
ncbi:MAG: response regulator [Nitrososphaera sp.]|uniref:response regulator n=1 Tax=Nitrososphaera sp. TaxID=1971748 RepID=UPI003D6F3338